MADRDLVEEQHPYKTDIEYWERACKQMREELNMLIALARLYKPNDRSETARYFAIWITDLEKIYAFYKTYLDVGG